jgi:transcriptional regulator with XRE-family HTH domain
MKITKQATDEVILGELGGRLAKIRLEHNLTQAQLATQAGVAKRTVERWEAGTVGNPATGRQRFARDERTPERN